MCLSIYTLTQLQMKTVSIVVLLVILHASLFAQQETFKGDHFIEVSGSAEMEVEPNRIFLLIRLREFEDNKQKVSLEKIDKDFLDALKAAGIDRSKLELSGGGSSIERINKRDQDAFREKSYQLMLTSASELEKLVVKLEPVRVYQSNITRLDHTDMDKFKLDLKVRALQAARIKAEVLLKSIGGSLGKPLMVREWEFGHQPFAGMDMMSNVRLQANEDFQQEQPIGFRKIKIREQITAQFEIK